VLRKWIANHTSQKELVSTGTRRKRNMMTRGRKTTFKVRVEITQFTLSRDCDYRAAIETYHVSYQQIYSWVKKYRELGMDGLQDGRGRNKLDVELSELERLRLENKRLQSRNEYLEIKEAIEKKGIELECRYGHFR
jgi:transposase